MKRLTDTTVASVIGRRRQWLIWLMIVDLLVTAIALGHEPNSGFRSDGGHGDIITSLLDGIARFIGFLGPSVFSYVLRVAALLLMAVWATANLFRRGNRSTFLQVVVAMLALLFAYWLPVERLYDVAAPMTRLILMVLSILVIVYLPPTLAFLLHPVRARQIQIATWIYQAIGLLFLLNLLFAHTA